MTFERMSPENNLDESVKKYLPLMTSKQTQDARKVARLKIIVNLKNMGGDVQAVAVRELLRTLQESKDGCQQNYLVDILKALAEPWVDREILKIADMPGTSLEPFVKAYIYAVLKKDESPVFSSSGQKIMCEQCCKLSNELPQRGLILGTPPL